MVFRKLKQYGCLMESDPLLPSVCGLITGAKVNGSWWSHPLAQIIFRVNEQLAAHTDVLVTKLISAKVTFVERKLWPAMLAVGVAREAWQTTALSPSALILLKLIDEQGSLRTDQLAWPTAARLKPGEAVRELEKRLLIHSEEMHTESGAHAKLIETWAEWTKRVRFPLQPVSAADAKGKLAEKLKALNEEFSASAWLPWQKACRSRVSGH
jgi:hypothetical protein